MKRVLFCLAVLQMSWMCLGCATDRPSAEPEASATAASQGVGEEIRSLVEDLSAGHDGRGKAAYRRIVQVGKPAVPYLREALEDPRKNVRWLSVEALGAIGGEEVLPPLMAALDDDDKDVRRYAAAFLGKWGGGNKKVIAALFEGLHDPDPEVAWHVIRALERLGETGYKTDHRLVDSLSSQLRSRDDERREHAAYALGLIGSPRACKPLVRALARPSAKPICRYTIADALCAIGSRDAVPLLVELLKDKQQDKRGCRCAARVLAKLADPSVNAELLPLTKSKYPWVREVGVTAVGFRQNAEVVERLIAIVQDETEEDGVREATAAALARIGDPRAVDALGKALVAEDVHIREKAAWALGETGAREAVPILVKALKDRACYVAMDAAESLGKLGDRAAAPAILELFNRDDALAMVGTNPSFCNIATVADRSLARITGEEAISEDVVLETREQLDEIRQRWQRILKLEETQAAPVGR